MMCRLSANVTVGVGAWVELIDWLTNLEWSLCRISPDRDLVRSVSSLIVLPLICPSSSGLIGPPSGVAPFSFVKALRFCCFSNVTFRTPIYLFKFEITSLANDYIGNSSCGRGGYRWSCWYSASSFVSKTGSSKTHIPWHKLQQLRMIPFNPLIKFVFPIVQLFADCTF